MDKKELEKKIKDNTNEILEDTLLDEDAPFEDTRAIKYEDIVQNTTKEKISKVPWIVAILLIIVISIIFGYMFLNSNPQTIFTMTVDNFFESITEKINGESYDISKGNIKAKFNLNTDNELINEIGKISLDADFSIDRANNLSKIKAKAKYDNNDLINLDLYSDEKNTYVYSKDLYETYIKLNNSYNIINPLDIKNVLIGLNQAIDKVATKEKIVGSKTSYDLGNSTIKVYESKLVVDSNNYESVSSSFINFLKSNNEFITSLSKILNIKAEDVNKKMDDFLPKLQKFFKENEKVEIKLYTDRKANKFIKGEVSGKNFNLSYNQDNNEFEIRQKDKTTKGKIKLLSEKNKYHFILDFNSNGNNNKVDIVLTNKKASSFGKVNIDGAKNFDELSDIDKFTIYSKLFTNTNLNKIIKYVA